MKIQYKTDEEMQQHSDMLRDVRNILNKNGIDPLLSNSALLEGMRSGDFMRWQFGKVFIVDSKIVIEKSESIINDLILCNFKIRKFFINEKNWKITAEKFRMSIEITGYYKYGEFWKRKVGKKYKAVPVKFYSRPFRKIKIRGEEYSIPFDSEEYLKLLYGENWRTPILAYKGSKFRNQELYKYE